MTPMTRDDAVVLANQMTTSTRVTRIHSTNTQCIEQMEADGDTRSPTPGLKTPRSGLYPFLKNVPQNVPFFYPFPITG